MARPQKTGLSYFPVDVDIFEDEKLQFISAKFGLKGEAIVFRLLSKIYRNGYYIEFDEDVQLLFSKSCGLERNDNATRNVVSELLKRNFFDKTMFEQFQVLTSKGIQKRYVKICNDSKRVASNLLPKYDLTPEETEFTPEETIINSGVNYTKKSKVKETKENQSKEENTPLRDFKKTVEAVVIENLISANDTAEQLIQNEKLHEYLSMNLKIKDSAKREAYILEFIRQKELEDLFPRKLSESKKHFLMWIIKKQEHESYRRPDRTRPNTNAIPPRQGGKFEFN